MKLFSSKPKFRQRRKFRKDKMITLARAKNLAEAFRVVLLSYLLYSSSLQTRCYC